MVRVLPDVSGLDKEFDYEVPPQWRDTIALGSIVRFDLQGRRVAGWVVDTDVAPPPGVKLRSLTKVSSIGPSAEIIELASWAAHRWHGRVSSILRTASPDTMVESLSAPPNRTPTALSEPQGELTHLISEALTQPGVTVVQAPPAADLLTVFEVVSQRGNAVIVAPDLAEARFLGGRFRRRGGRVALAGRDFALAATGGIVTGARSAVWATVPGLDAMVVIDEHAEALQEERNPTWNARDVAIERARRADVPCVLISASPSLAALAVADRTLRFSRQGERRGWPLVRVIDRRTEDPGRPSLFSPELVTALRGEGRVVCVLNRTGRAKMLACGSCGELVRTEDGNHLMAEVDGQLVASTGERRPMICAQCAGTRLKRLRLGVNRAREELEALAGEPVNELTGSSSPVELKTGRIVVGTEAVLHRVHDASTVCFLDFDQELLAPRYRAAEQALGLLTRAARLVGGRSDGGTILIQTRSPEHRVLRSLSKADPAGWVPDELELRRSLRFPPFGALAEVSGDGAASFLAPLTNSPANEHAPALPMDLGESAFSWALFERIDVLGPRPDGRFLLRADTADLLADALSVLPRPKGRVRVAVDPPRV